MLDDGVGAAGCCRLYALALLSEAPFSMDELPVDDEKLPHHDQVLVIENVAVEHVWNVFSGIGVESGCDDDLTLGIHQHGVLPT